MVTTERHNPQAAERVKKALPARSRPYMAKAESRWIATFRPVIAVLRTRFARYELFRL
jgi:hypothetical protein